VSAALTKDASIWQLVGALAGRLDAHQFQIIDHWDADLFAIGIARADEPARLVYVSTYQQPPEHYAFECEEPHREQEYGVGKRADKVTFDQLVDVIRRHLSMAGSPNQ
jgi:hypothetical protein